MMRGVVKDSAKVYNYMTDLNLKQDLVTDEFQSLSLYEFI